jgi:hypothetical protein
MAHSISAGQANVPHEFRKELSEEFVSELNAGIHRKEKPRHGRPRFTFSADFDPPMSGYRQIVTRAG